MKHELSLPINIPNQSGKLNMKNDKYNYATLEYNTMLLKRHDHETGSFILLFFLASRSVQLDYVIKLSSHLRLQ